MSKGPSVFCSLHDYVEKVDAELGEALRQTCVHMTLNSLKGKKGVTFFRPADSKVKNAIYQKISSGVIADMQEAIDTLNAMIFRIHAKTPADLLSQKGETYNSLNPPQLVEIKGEVKVGDVMGIEFANGAKAIPDSAFKTTKPNVAAWILVSGSLPTTGGKIAERPAKGSAFAKVPVKKGSYQPDQAESSNIRFQIMIAIENDFKQDQICRRSCGYIGQYKRDVFLEYALSLWYAVYQSNPALAKDLLGLVSYDKTDIYFLLEPHKPSSESDYLIPDEIVRSWWSSPRSVNISMVSNLITEELKNSTEGSLFSSNRLGLIDAVNDMREEIVLECRDNARLYPQKIYSHFIDFYKKGTVNGENIYGGRLNELYMRDPEMKLIHDELRYLVSGWFRKLTCAPELDVVCLEDCFNKIGDFLHARGEERKRICRLVNPDRTNKPTISPEEICRSIKAFVCSSAFGYVPFVRGEELPFKVVTNWRESTKFTAVYNMEEAKLVRHQRLLDEYNRAKNAEVIGYLNSIGNLDPSLDALIKKLSL